MASLIFNALLFLHSCIHIFVFRIKRNGENDTDFSAWSFRSFFIYSSPVHRRKLEEKFEYELLELNLSLKKLGKEK